MTISESATRCDCLSGFLRIEKKQCLSRHLMSCEYVWLNPGLEELCSWAPTMVSRKASHMEHNADSQLGMDGCVSFGRVHMEGHMLFVWHVPLCSLAQVLVS